MQIKCYDCPIGYYCPCYGNYSPIPCDSGYICDSSGLIKPKKICIAGAYCLGNQITIPNSDFCSNPNTNVYGVGSINYDIKVFTKDEILNKYTNYTTEKVIDKNN